MPVICLTGHVRWNTLTVLGGILHLPVQSLTESFTSHPEPPATWGLLELAEAIALQVFGRDPFAARLDTAATARCGITPLAPFAETPELRAR